MWVWRLKLVRPKIEDRRRKKRMRPEEHWVKCSGRKGPAVEEIESVFEENRQTRSAHNYCRARIIRNYTMENNWVVRYSRFQSKAGMSHIFISAANYRRSSQLQFFFWSSTNSFFSFFSLSYFKSATNSTNDGRKNFGTKKRSWLKILRFSTTRAKETSGDWHRACGGTDVRDPRISTGAADELFARGIAVISIQLSLIPVQLSSVN